MRIPKINVRMTPWWITLVALLALLPFGVGIQFVGLFILAVELWVRGNVHRVLAWDALGVVGVYTLLVWMGFVGALLCLRKLKGKEVGFRSLILAAFGWNGLALVCACTGCCIIQVYDPQVAWFVISILLFLFLAFLIKRLPSKS